LLLPCDVHRDTENSRRRATNGAPVTAAARGDPADSSIRQDEAKLDLIGTAGRQRALNCGRAHGAIVGMNVSGQRGVIDGFARLEAKELPSFIRSPDAVVR